MKIPADPSSRRLWIKHPLVGPVFALMASLLGGCSPGTPNGQAVPRPAVPEVPADSQVVTVFTFDEYTEPELLREFKERTGIGVELRFYDETDEMIESLKSNPGEYDVFLCEDGYIPILAGKRMMKPLDRSKLKNWKNLDPVRLNQPFDPGNEFTVPYLWGTTLLAYRKDLVPNPRPSWSLIFDPALKDKVCFMNERMECYAGVLRSMGINLPEADQAAISTAADSMVKLVREHGLRLGSEKDVKQYLIEGSCGLSMMYSGDAARLAAENPSIPLGYFIPEEGATVWTDSFCISRDSTRVENAHRFLDFMLEANSAAASSNFAHYASPNLAAKPFIDAALLADETIYPRPEVLAKCSYFKLRDVDSQRMVNSGWRRVTEAWLERSGQVSNSAGEPEPAPAAPSLPN